ncbi:MAG: acyl-CoA thioesterase/bile acid-CoA:amino acid N-acyltransferase family protein [bacterium]
MKKFFIILLLATIIVVGFIFLKEKNMPKIIITPDKALLDEAIEISISNLKANEQITIEASCKDKDNNPWISRAMFQADEKGMINIAKQAPISGSYEGIDPMGLFWSMAPTNKDPSKNTFVSQITLNLCKISLSVFSGDKLRAQKTIYRLPVAPNIERKDIREQSIVGTLFYPQNTKNGAGVIVIPGSGGGIPEYISQLIASHGYTVLALAYFGYKELPKNLSQIPLEYFQNAMHWFKKQPQVDGNKIALMGHSRGAELVLLLSSMFPGEMDAAIVFSAPHLVYGDFLPENKSAWTYKNKPLPFMPYPSDKEIFEAADEGLITLHKGTIEDPFQDSEIFLYGINKFNNLIKETTIPVENIRCPLLIISGEDDAMWPSAVAGNSIIERLNSKGSKIVKKHIIYPNAGHNLLIIPYVPSIDLPVHIGSGWGLFGGTPEGNAHAYKESWREELNFLDEVLNKDVKKKKEL